MKKAFAIILTVVLAMTCASTPSSAAEAVTVSTPEELLEAISEAADNSTICLRGGAYRFEEPVRLNGIRKNIKICSVPGETAILTNSCAVTEWTECTVNGIRVLCAPAGGRRVSALFSENGSLSVTRMPETGFWHIEEPDLSDTKGSGNDLASNGFYTHELAKTPSNLSDVTVEVLHQWVSEVERAVSFDAGTGLMKLARYSGRPIEKGDRFFIENAVEGLCKPGEWCFDSAADKIYYVPSEDETADDLTLYASFCAKLLDISDSSGITFENVKFADTGWEYSDDAYLNMNIHTRLRDYLTSSVQGAVDVCGAIEITYSDNINFKNCDFENIGVAAIRFFSGAKNCSVESCYFGNTGAEAVYIGGRFMLGEDVTNSADDLAENISVRNCEIEKYGRRFFGACGIIITYCDRADIANNEIHDGFYSGISAGFMWLFGDNPTENITIRDNLIYDIGTDTLSDLGGIYLLGVQKGTSVSGNVIHDCSCYSEEGGYAGDGIYLDSGCEFMKIENNLVFNCSTSCFNTTLSKNNTIKNNIFAFGGQSVACIGPEQYADMLTGLNNAYVGNIFLTDNKVPVIESLQHEGHFGGHGNILWDMTSGDELYFTIGNYTDDAIIRQNAEARNTMDAAIFADPGFADAKAFDFSLNGNADAVKLGFEPFDYAKAGTVKNTVVGLDREGGLTAYNAGTENYGFRTASVPCAEKFKLAFNRIADFFKTLFGRLFCLETPETTDFYTTDYTARGKSERTQELASLLNAVKEHTPRYTEDPSRKPFADDDRIKAVYFDGEEYRGRATKVFAYIGFPETASKEDPVPAMVLVHGGGVHAQADWVQYWTDRGYAAISFDGMAQQPKEGYYSAAGNNNPDWTVNPESHLPFASFDDINREYTEQWFYYFISDIILSNNILRADERVIPGQIGVSGISWGGLATTVAACYDERFSFAIPIYGCGCWELFGDIFAGEQIYEKWDPTPLFADVNMPVLFVSGDEDPFFPADALCGSAALAKKGSALLINGLKHGDFRIEETIRFADEQTGRNGVNIRLTGVSENNGKLTVGFDLPSDARNAKVRLYYRNTPLEYDNMAIKESWASKTAFVCGGKASVTIPDGAVMYYVCVSAKYGELFSRDTISASTGIFGR